VKSKDINLPFGYDKMHEPVYACDKARPHLRGVMFIVTPMDEMIKPMDLQQMKCVDNTYVVKTSPSNAENFNTDKNAYFDRIKKFLNS
jgi:hypothetical protein